MIVKPTVYNPIKSTIQSRKKTAYENRGSIMKIPMKSTGSQPPWRCLGASQLNVLAPPAVSFTAEIWCVALRVIPTAPMAEKSGEFGEFVVVDRLMVDGENLMVLICFNGCNYH